MTISYDPPKDGNCQFHCIARLLSSDPNITHTDVRRDIVAYLREERPADNIIAGSCQFLEPRGFIDGDWNQYLMNMSKPGHFGDHITLCAAARLYNKNIVIISNRGDQYNVVVGRCDSDQGPRNNEAGDSRSSKLTILLGHFDEDTGAHYVCLEPSTGSTTAAIMSARCRLGNQSGNNKLLISGGNFCERTVSSSSEVECRCSEPPVSLLSGAAEENGKANDNDKMINATAFPDCWSHAQYVYFTHENPWLEVLNSCLGCRVCKSAKRLTTKTSQGVQLACEWTECRIKCHGITLSEQKDSLRKKIHAHRTSKAHLRAVEMQEDLKRDTVTACLANQQRDIHETTCRVFRTVYKIIKLNRPFTDYETDIQLQQLNGLNMGRILHSRKSCSNIAVHIGAQMRTEVASNIVSSKTKFGILIDESTTASKLSTLIIYLRASFGSCDPVTLFLDLVELSSTTAANITSALLTCLAHYGFSEGVIAECCVGLACDGASTMLGKEAGVGKLLQNKFPRIFVWHCVAHRLELSVHDTAKEVTGVNNFKSFVDKLYSLYSMSPKNQVELRQVASDLEVQLLSIGRVLDTRWVASSMRTVRAVWQSYAALYQHFVSASKDPKRDSRERSVYSGLAERLSCRHFVTNLALMFDALQELSELSRELQKRDVTLLSAHRAVSRQIMVFEAMCNEAGPHLAQVNSSIQQSNTFVGVVLHSGGKVDVQIRPEQFYRSLVNNLRNRMLATQSSRVPTSSSVTSNASLNAAHQYDELVSLTKVLSPDNWPEFADSESCTDVATAPSLFGEKEVQVMCERLNVDGRQSIRAYRKFRECGGKSVPAELRQLLRALSTIPVCTAECERGFSQMNLIITPVRNCLSVTNVSCIMFAKLVGPVLARFDALKYVKTWLTTGRHSADDVNSVACGGNDDDDIYTHLWDVM